MYLGVEVLRDLVQPRLCSEVEDEVRELHEDAGLPPAREALGPLQGLLLLLDGGRGPAHPGADLYHRELHAGGRPEVGAPLAEDGGGRGQGRTLVCRGPP